MRNLAQKLFIIFAVLCLTSCVGFLSQLRPNNHNESVYGVVRVQMSHSEWDSTHIEFAKEAMRNLSNLGPTFVLVEFGGDVVVYDVDLANDGPNECRTTNEESMCAGWYGTVDGEERILIDPVMTPGKLAFQAALMHEIGHYLGMEHICESDNTESVCSPVGRGPAIMNPNLLHGEDSFSYHHAYTGPLPVWEVQSLDIAEFLRVWALRHPARN